MKKLPSITWKTAASLVCLAWLGLLSSASATLSITGSNQNGASPFAPAFPVAADSLIAGQKPMGYAGSFTQQAQGIPVLTDGTIGTVTTGNTANFATAGNSGGQMLIYNLPASAHGYDLTNITVFSGWPDGGRHAQAYTLYYSTIDHPTSFLLLGTVAYDGGFHNPSSPYGPANPSVNRVVWADSLGGVIATNVAAIKFDFTTPTSAYGENGFSGYAEITVQGTAAAAGPVQTVLITATSEQGPDPFTPDYVLPSDSLIAGQFPTATNGTFTMELSTRDVTSLTAGGSLELMSVTGDKDNRVGLSTCSANYVTCGGGSSSGNTLIYALTNSANGSDVTNIAVYSGWTSNGRMGQYFTVSYATISAPTTYIPVATVCYLPILPANDTANRVAISAMNGVPLGKNVASLKFDFGSPAFAPSFDYGFQGYAQIIVQGTNSAPPSAAALTIPDPRHSAGTCRDLCRRSNHFHGGLQQFAAGQPAMAEDHQRSGDQCRYQRRGHCDQRRPHHLNAHARSCAIDRHRCVPGGRRQCHQCSRLASVFFHGVAGGQRARCDGGIGHSAKQRPSRACELLSPLDC